MHARLCKCLLLALLPACIAAEQHVLQAEEVRISNANRIFNQVQGAGKTWWQVWFPNGRALMPVTIPEGTNLYHGNDKHRLPRTGLGWYGIEPEHAYNYIHLNLNTSEGMFWTFQTRRELRALYIDGQSAGRSPTGNRDSQQILADGAVCDKAGEYFCNDEELAVGLCRIARELGIDGFVRALSAFEYLACDFADPIYEQISAVRASFRYSEHPPRPIGDRLALSEHPYAISTFASMYRAAMTHADGDPRLHLRPEHMLSLYDERDYPSLAKENRRPVLKQRLLDMSAADLTAYRSELRQINDDWSEGRSSGLPWAAITATIVNRYAVRLAEVESILTNRTAIHADELKEVHRLVLALHSMIFPYIDAPIVLESWRKRSPSAKILASLKKSKQLCATAYTRNTEDGLNKQEKRIKAAIEDVLEQICTTTVDLFGDALLTERAGRVKPGAFEQWVARLSGLMDWLDWRPIWTRADRQCEWDEMLWLKTYAWSTNSSLTPYDDQPPPKCIKMEDVRLWVAEPQKSSNKLF